MITVTNYKCEGCGMCYPTRDECQECEARGIVDFKSRRPFRPAYSVGELVECGEYGWHERPNSMWTREFVGGKDARSATVRNGKPILYALRYVICAINDVNHTRRYNLWQAVQPQASAGPRVVSTSAHHIRMTRISNAEIAKWVKTHRAAWEGKIAQLSALA